MFNYYFFHNTIRNYIVSFGTLFNGISIVRRKDDTVQTIQVPIAYGPGELWLKRIRADPQLAEKFAGVTVPRLAFELKGMTYDASRKLNSMNTYTKSLDNNDNAKMKRMYEGVPYNLEFELTAYTKYMDDLWQIVEQIVPNFTPKFNQEVMVVNDLGLKLDTDIILNSVNLSDDYEGSLEERRTILVVFSFTLKGYLFPSIKVKGVIQQVQFDLSPVSNTSFSTLGSIINDDEMAVTGRASRISVSPGLASDGSPTSNSSVSVAVSQISSNSEYGYIEDLNFYQDGLKYNPVTGNDE